MSPSRRRAWRGARLCLPHPAAALSLPPPRLAPYRHYARALLVRRDGDIAPYRHYPREIHPRLMAVRTARCGRVRWGHRPWGLPTLPARALPPLPPRNSPPPRGACVPPVRVGGAMLGYRASRPLCSFLLKTPAPPSCAPLPVAARLPVAPYKTNAFVGVSRRFLFLSNVFPLCPTWVLC